MHGSTIDNMVKSLSISGKNITVTKGDNTTTTLTTQDTTYSVATSGQNGLMSKDDKSKLLNTNIAYGTCSTDANISAKEVTIIGNSNWALTPGSEIVVKFTVTNTASNPTLNVNGTGAKSIIYDTKIITDSNLSKVGSSSRFTKFMYDGTNYIWMGQSVDDNSTYTPAILGNGYGICSTNEEITAKIVKLSNYNLVTNGIVSVKFNNSVPANSTMNINSKGVKNIFYRGKAIIDNIIKAGDIATFIYDGTQYQFLGVDRQESSSGGTTILYNTPIGAGYDYYGQTAPDGFLFADGSEISRTEYKELFNVIGTRFGNGDGVTTFNLPDKRGRMSRMINTNESDEIGQTGGSATVTISKDNLPDYTLYSGSHRHSNIVTGVSVSRANTWDINKTASSVTNVTAQKGTAANATITVKSGGSGKEVNVMNPYLNCNYIIRVK